MLKNLVQVFLKGFVRALGCLWWDHALPWQHCLSLPAPACPCLACCVAALASWLTFPWGAAQLLLPPDRTVYEMVLKHPFKCQSTFPSWTCYMVMCYFSVLGSRPDSTFYGQCGKRSKNFFLLFSCSALLCKQSNYCHAPEKTFQLWKVPQEKFWGRKCL